MKYSESQALSKMAAYCSKAERAEFDIRRKLQKWEIEESVISSIVSRLIKEKFLDEERYCRSFIKDKLHLNKWGKTKITFELKRKQISSSTISSCFDEIDNQEFENSLKKLLITKAKSIKAADGYEKKIKLIRFGLGRGYSFEQIKSCLPEILNSDDNEYPEPYF